MPLDYEMLVKEAISFLEKEQSLVLATSTDDNVTARTMSHVNDGLDIYFQTGDASKKFMQIQANPRIALAVGYMQIEAFAEILGHPGDNPRFIDMYKAKFPRYYEKYTNHPDEIVIKANPTKISFYKYVDGTPCKDILDIHN